MAVRLAPVLEIALVKQAMPGAYISGMRNGRKEKLDDHRGYYAITSFQTAPFLRSYPYQRRVIYEDRSGFVSVSVRKSASEAGTCLSCVFN